MKLICRVVLLVTMLSAFARAAFMPAPFGAGIRRTNARLIARSMTSENDTSVVETCREKIRAALGTDDVTVTGV
jgi:hypothetical protein